MIVSINNPAPQKAGYSLVVVLFSLTVLTLIFGVSSTRTLTHITRNQTDNLLATQRLEALAVADLLFAEGIGEELSFSVDIGGKEVAVALQAATGLVDLNTASPALMRTFLEGFLLPSDKIASALEKYRAWRRDGRRLLRTGDFLRVTGLSNDDTPRFTEFTTVFSGRSGISAEQAPLGLLEHLTRGTGPRDQLVLNLGDEFVTAGSNTNIHLVVDGRLHAAFVAHFGSSAADSRLIEIN